MTNDTPGQGPTRLYAKPALTRYTQSVRPEEYVIASGTPNAAKCTNNPPGCRGRGRGGIAPPPWG